VQHCVDNSVGGGSENNSIDSLVVLVVFVVMVSVATLTVCRHRALFNHILSFYFACPILF